VTLAISGGGEPSSARRVTVEPRKSWKLRFSIPALAAILPHDVRNPSDVHGAPLWLVRMNVDRLGVWSSSALRGNPTLIETARFPLDFDWVSLMGVPL